VTIGPDAVVVTVDDDGRGIPVAITVEGSGGSDADAGAGVRGMRERAAALGGAITFARPAAGGTRVRATLPMGAQA
jgi:signal transduction histidine kinase